MGFSILSYDKKFFLIYKIKTGATGVCYSILYPLRFSFLLFLLLFGHALSVIGGQCF